jgi:hypothetical protein
MRISIVLSLALAAAAACSKKNPDSEPTTTPEPTTEQPPADDGNHEERPGLTAATCEAQGGKVIGDIGDGAVNKPDYRCPDSGEPPLGSVVAEPGGPVAIEGSVCCK